MAKYKYLSNENGISILLEGRTISLIFLMQEIYDPKNNIIKYYEFLSRVSDDGVFFDNEDFFKNLDEDIIKNICINQLEYARRNGVNKQVSVNITLACLNDDHFVFDLALFKGLDFALEINDIKHIHLNDNVIKNINILKSMGVSFWLDDFYAEGNDGLLTLGVIQWDHIKIDKSFLWKNYENASSLVTISNFLKAFAKSGLIFEGVETDNHNSVVKQAGALAQGYFHSYPKSWKDIRLRYVRHSELN